MARITVEDCLKKVENQYDLVLLAKERTVQLNAGSPMLVEEDNDKRTIISLREIGDGKIDVNEIEESAIKRLRKEPDEIEQQEGLLPDKMKRAFPYMKAQNWLTQYRSITGLETILGQMERRTKFESNLSASVKNLEAHYPVFKNDFEVFFEQIQIFVSSRINSSINTIL